MARLKNAAVTPLARPAAAPTRLRVFTGDHDDHSSTNADLPTHGADELTADDSLFAAARVAAAQTAQADGLSRPIELPAEVDALCRTTREVAYTDSIHAAARLAAARPWDAWADDSPEHTSLATPPAARPAQRDGSGEGSGHRARILARDLDVLRHRRVVRVLNRLFDRYDLQNTLPAAYQQLRDDSLLFQQNLRGFRLQMSVNLQRVGGLGYSLMLPRSGLNGLLIAPVADARPTKGTLRVEIHSLSGELAARATFPAAQLHPDTPVRMDFAPINCREHDCRLGIFADDVNVPLYLYEWRRYRFCGLGRTQTLPFCALLSAGEA